MPTLEAGNQVNGVIGSPVASVEGAYDAVAIVKREHERLVEVGQRRDEIADVADVGHDEGLISSEDGKDVPFPDIRVDSGSEDVVSFDEEGADEKRYYHSSDASVVENEPTTPVIGSPADETRHIASYVPAQVDIPKYTHHPTIRTTHLPPVLDTISESPIVSSPVRSSFETSPLPSTSRPESYFAHLSTTTTANAASRSSNDFSLARQPAAIRYPSASDRFGSPASHIPMDVAANVSTANLSNMSASTTKYETSDSAFGRSDLEDRSNYDNVQSYFSSEIWSVAFPRPNIYGQTRTRAATVDSYDRPNPATLQRHHSRRSSTLSASAAEEDSTPLDTDTSFLGLFTSATKAFFGPLRQDPPPIRTQPTRQSSLQRRRKPSTQQLRITTHRNNSLRRPGSTSELNQSPTTTCSISSSFSSNVATPGARYFAPSDEHHGEEYHGQGNFIRRKTKGWAYGVDAASECSTDRATSRGDGESEAETESHTDEGREEEFEDGDGRLGEGEEEEEDGDVYSRHLRDVFDDLPRDPPRESDIGNADTSSITSLTAQSPMLSSVASLAASFGFGFGSTSPTNETPPQPTRTSSSTSILTISSAPRRGIDLHRPAPPKHSHSHSQSLRSDIGPQYRVYRPGPSTRSDINISLDAPSSPNVSDILGPDDDTSTILSISTVNRDSSSSTVISTPRSTSYSHKRWSGGSDVSMMLPPPAVMVGPVPVEFWRLGVFVDVGEFVSVGSEGGEKGKKFGKLGVGVGAGGGYTSYSVTVKLLRPDIPMYNNSSATTLTVRKRYREFRTFYETLLLKYRHVTGWPEFPKKSFFDRFSSQTVHHRHTLFTHFLRFVALHPTLYNCPATRQFLGVSAKQPQQGRASLGRGVAGGGVVIFERGGRGSGDFRGR
ncbi:hypothetical protein HDV00_003131 [Rhizophlyctis rosea]|nr:hypothetical protein HDV00_003131 [Rhizophlyctis rosea]